MNPGKIGLRVPLVIGALNQLVKAIRPDTQAMPQQYQQKCVKLPS